MLTKYEAAELKNSLSVVNYKHSTHREYVMTYVFNYIDSITEKEDPRPDDLMKVVRIMLDVMQFNRVDNPSLNAAEEILEKLEEL